MKHMFIHILNELTIVAFSGRDLIPGFDLALNVASGEIIFEIRIPDMIHGFAVFGRKCTLDEPISLDILNNITIYVIVINHLWDIGLKIAGV